MKNKNKLVGIIMGSKSDWNTMRYCSDTLNQFKIKHDVKVISAHRTPKRLHKYLKEAEKKGIEIIIAGAGGAAHLAGVAASITLLPVLGIPITQIRVFVLNFLPICLKNYILILN